MPKTSLDLQYSKDQNSLGSHHQRRLPSLTENILTDQLIASNGPAVDVTADAVVNMNKLCERILSGTFNSVNPTRDQNGVSVLHSDNM